MLSGLVGLHHLSSLTYVGVLHVQSSCAYSTLQDTVGILLRQQDVGAKLQLERISP